jgi:3-oxoadipate enol-lactonase
MVQEQSSLRIRANAVDLGYDDHGIGQPMIFLHAFPLNRGMWEFQTRELLKEQRYRLVTLDWRGFGESDITDAVSTMEMFADDVAAVMDALGMQQAILCGLSMGGYVAFAFLRKYARRVSGLILADTRSGADTQEGKQAREKLAQLAETQGTGAIADLQLPRLLSEGTLQQLPEIVAHSRRMIEAATTTGIAAASRGMALRSDSSDLLASIRCPTLVVGGEHDLVTPPAEMRAMAEQIPGAQYAAIPQAGHLSNLEQPETFLHTVSQFLRAAF